LRGKLIVDDESKADWSLPPKGRWEYIDTSHQESRRTATNPQHHEPHLNLHFQRRPKQWKELAQMGETGIDELDEAVLEEYYAILQVFEEVLVFSQTDRKRHALQLATAGMTAELLQANDLTRRPGPSAQPGPAQRPHQAAPSLGGS
jgi:hypothetical protein